MSFDDNGRNNMFAYTRNVFDWLVSAWCASDVRWCTKKHQKHRQRQMIEPQREMWQVVYLLLAYSLRRKRVHLWIKNTPYKNTLSIRSTEHHRKIFVGILQLMCDLTSSHSSGLCSFCYIVVRTVNTKIVWLSKCCVYLKTGFWLSCWVPFIIHFIVRSTDSAVLFNSNILALVTAASINVHNN